MLRKDSALQAELGDVQSMGQMHRRKRAEMLHFDFNKLSLKQQAMRLQHVHNLSDEAIAPIIEFIDTRLWTPASVPVGADAWVVGTSPELYEDRKAASEEETSRLIRDCHKSIRNEVDKNKLKEQAPNLHTLKCMRQLMEKQPKGPLKVYAIQAGLYGRHHHLSLAQAEAKFEHNEFSLGDVEFLSILSNFPDFFDTSYNCGAVVGGDRFGEMGNVMSYQVLGHRLTRRLIPRHEVVKNLSVITAFVF